MSSRPPQVLCRTVSFIAWVGVVTVPGVATAGDWYVDGGDPGCATGTGGMSDPFCTIADALSAAIAGDTIHVAPGTYSESLVLDRDLTLLGTQGRDVTIVDAGGADRVVTVEDGVVARIEGLTLTGGDGGEEGGGLRLGVGADVTLTETTVTNNSSIEPINLTQTAGRGGGVFADASSFLRLEQSRVHANRSIQGGGLWLSANSTCTLDHSEVIGNNGGIISPYLYQGTGGGVQNAGLLTITDSTISNNTTVEAGGGILNTGTLEILSSSITNNEARADDSLLCCPTFAAGGGIDNKGTLTVEDTILAGNIAASHTSSSGGAIHNHTGGDLILRRSLVRENRVFGSSNNGSAIVTFGSILTMNESTLIEQSTIVDNTGAPGFQNTGLLSLPPAHISNSILWNNTSTQITGDVTVNYSNVEGGWSGTGNGNSDPLFVNAAGDDYRLSVSSPCIDAGDPSLASCGEVDLRGTPRLLDGDLDRTPRIDMGALEFSHVELDVIGDVSPGGSFDIEVTGSAGFPALMFVGFAEATTCHPRFGPFFVDFGNTWVAIPWGPIPSTTPVTFGPGLPTPFDLVLQVLTATGGAGNTSRAFSARVE